MTIPPKFMRSLRRHLLGGISSLTAVSCSTDVLSARLGSTYGLDDQEVDSETYDHGHELGIEFFRASHGWRRPLVVFFPGGAWQRASGQVMYRTFARSLASRGLVVALPEYRTYPQVLFPSFLDDSAHAVAYAIRRAAALGADPDRVYLMGHSAGAYNAMMLGHDPGRLLAAGVPAGTIRGTVGISGPYTRARLRHWAVADVFAGRADEEIDLRHMIRPDAPPTLLLTGDADAVVPLEESRVLHDAIKARGGRVTLEVLPGVGHLDPVSSGPWLPTVDEVVGKSASFIRGIGRAAPAWPVAAWRFPAADAACPA